MLLEGAGGCGGAVVMSESEMELMRLLLGLCMWVCCGVVVCHVMLTDDNMW